MTVGFKSWTCDNIEWHLALSHNLPLCSRLMTDSPSPHRKTIASIQKALDILNLFEGARSELGNAEIAKLVNLPVGTASGLIYTLKVNHYLDQNPVNRKYRLGLKLAERAAVLLNQLDLRQIAAPHLEKLRDWSGESVNLGILDGLEVVYIERLFGKHALAIRSELGKRAPVHSTAMGKVIIAYLPQAETQVFLDQYPLSPVTRYTITERDRFEAELARIRKMGFSIDEEENEIGGRCVAAPIFNHDCQPVAALSISVPIQRLPREQIPAFGERIKEVAQAISEKLGYPRY